MIERLRAFVEKAEALLLTEEPWGAENPYAADLNGGWRAGLTDMSKWLDTGDPDVRRYFATMAEWFRQTAPHGYEAYGELTIYAHAADAIGLGNIWDLEIVDEGGIDRLH